MNRTLAALALAASALLAACSSKECTLPEIKCGDRCVDGSSDPSNCGACGVTVGPGLTCCGAPVDLLTDAFNCGACGRRCPVNGVCNAGTCECPAGLPTQCGTNPGTCVNLDTGDGGYCGACGRVCQGTFVGGADATCTAGDCVCAGTPQATDCRATSPSVVCLNTLVDPANCGTCGHRCPPHATCASDGAPSPAGVCGCDNPPFTTDCGATIGCVDKLTDRSNCGSCGHVCTGSSPVCSSGICCPTGQVSCNGACVNRQTDTANCGACGNACAAGRTCVAGTCTCAGDTPLACGASCCGGTTCCSGGTTCQPLFSNGLGGTFYSGCSSSPTLSRDLALAAANSWQTGTATFDLFCAGRCLARQTNTSCAMWCWEGPYAGRVMLGGLPCDALCNGFIGGATGNPWP